MEVIDKAINLEKLAAALLNLATPCGPAFFNAIVQELDKCLGKFYRACDFGHIVGPVCPFGPVDKFRAFQYEQIEVRVKALESKMTKG